MLSRQILPIPIGPVGADTRTDPKVLRAPGLEVAENVKFTTPGRLEKREGFSSLATAADAVASAGDALYAMRRDTGKVYNSASASFTNIPPLTSMTVERLFGSAAGALHGDPDVARAGNRDYMVSEASVAGGAIRIHCYSRTTADGLITTSQSVSSGVARPRIVAIGSSVYVFYTSGANLLFTSSNNGVLGAEVTVVSNLNATPIYDVAVSGSQILLVYRNTAGDFISGYVSTSGVLGSTNTDTPAAAPSCVGVAVSSATLNYGIMWGINSTTTVMARLYDGSRVALTAATAISTTATTNIRHVVGAFDSAGTVLSVFYEHTDPLDLPELYKVSRGSINTSSVVVSGAIMYRHSTLLSKPWVIASNGSDQTYICLGYDGALQASVMIVRWNASSSSAQVVGRAMPDEVLALSRRPSFVSQAFLAGSTALVGFPGGSAAGSGNIPVTLEAFTIGSATQYASVGLGGQLYVAGAMLEIAAPSTAGTSTGTALGNCESQPLLFPEYFTFTPANSTGSMTSNTTYTYRLYWEMYDGNGAVVRSSYAGSQSVTMGATDNQVTITVNSISHTNTSGNSKPMWLGVYRSEAGSGLIHYRVSAYPSFTTSGANYYAVNDPTADTITFVDRRSDAVLITGEIDYQSSDPVELDNIHPPPHRLIAAGNNRVFLSGFENDSNLIWVSKLRETVLEPIVFNDALTISVDAGDGPITGLACVRDSLVVFREHQIYVVGGDGPDNVGLGGSFSPSQIISEDVGCTESRSIVRIPNGVLFKSKKGIYLLDNGLSLSYIGARMQDYNSETITSAVALSSNHEVRFTTASRTMIYDYLADAWATWTVPATHACLWQDQWVALDGTTAMVPTPGAYLDRTGAGYTMAVETGWITIQNLQAWNRVYGLLFLGSYEGQHAPRVRIAYDFNTTWVDDDTWSGVTSTAPYQFLVKPSRQKFQAIKIRIEDVANGGTLGNGFTLSEIALDVGVKSGTKPKGTTETAT